MIDLTELSNEELNDLRDQARSDRTPESYELRFRIIKERLFRLTGVNYDEEIP